MKTITLFKRITSKELDEFLKKNSGIERSCNNKREEYPIVVTTNIEDAMTVAHFVGLPTNSPSGFTKDGWSMLKLMALIHNISLDLKEGPEISIDEFVLATERAKKIGIFFMLDPNQQKQK